MNYFVLFQQLNSFMKSHGRNRWLDDGIIKIYVRKSTRVLNGNVYNCLDLANIEVINKNDQKKGVFTNFLKELLRIYQGTNIFVESILNPKVESILNKFNFSEHRPDPLQLNMFLIQEKF